MRMRGQVLRPSVPSSGWARHRRLHAKEEPLYLFGFGVHGGGNSYRVVSRPPWRVGEGAVVHSCWTMSPELWAGLQSGQGPASRASCAQVAALSYY